MRCGSWLRHSASLVVGVAVMVASRPALGLSSDRAGNLFCGDEPIVLKTTATGTANWTLANDYGETMQGAGPVADGRVRIPTDGLRFGKYTFAVEGDGQLVGGVVPPIVQVHPDLAPLIFAYFRLHWNNPEEALMWAQLGAWEVRFEYGLNGMNPEKGKFVFDSNIDAYMQALADQGIRPSFKVNGPQSWNDSSTVARKRGEPKDYQDYTDALQAYARHNLKYGIDRYYIVNEPEQGGWWSAGWPGYYRFLTASGKALKEVDNRILTIGPNSWSNTPEFLDTSLKTGVIDVCSGHYPVEKIIGNIHGSYYFTRMRETGVILPFINAEDFSRWRSNLTLEPTRKDYPGITGYSSVWGAGPVLMVNMDVGAYRTVALHLMMDQEPWPFARWEAGNIVPDTLCFTMRTAVDELAGAQLIKRVEAPPDVLGWVYQRGPDRFFGGYVAVGQMTQMMVIHTSASRLRVVDCFGNEQMALADGGKVRLLLTNAEVYVHGLAAGDTFEFVPPQEREPMRVQLMDAVTAAVGVPLRIRLDGWDPQANIVARQFPQWRLTDCPPGMTIGPASGLIQWTPKEPGSVKVSAELNNQHRSQAGLTFTVDVKPAGTNLAPKFVSRPAPVAVKNGEYRYRPKAVDANGDAASFSVKGPEGMSLANGQVTWKPAKEGVYNVVVTADDGKGGLAEQRFDLAVVPNPDRPAEGVMPPRPPGEPTVTRATADTTTLVWNPHALSEYVVQRSAAREGPWEQVAVSKDNWFTDRPVGATAYYRVLARNSGGDSEPTDVVNGRNRAPIADAGASRKLAEAGEVELDGSASFDPEGKALSYFWRVVAAPTPTAAVIGDPASAKLKLTTSQEGRYILELRVDDGQEKSKPDYVWVTVGGDAGERVAYGGPDRFVRAGEKVELKAVAFSPAKKQSKWFWRWDNGPIDGYCTVQDSKQPGASLTPAKPGVYELILWPLDDTTYGYPDVVRVMVDAPQ